MLFLGLRLLTLTSNPGPLPPRRSLDAPLSRFRCSISEARFLLLPYEMLFVSSGVCHLFDCHVSSSRFFASSGVPAESLPPCHPSVLLPVQACSSASFLMVSPRVAMVEVSLGLPASGAPGGPKRSISQCRHLLACNPQEGAAQIRMSLPATRILPRCRTWRCTEQNMLT